jgi:hypothetical protein
MPGFAALLTGVVVRRVTTIAAIVVLCVLALLGIIFVLRTPGTTYFRGRDFTDAGCHLDAAAKRYRVPMQHWPGLGVVPESVVHPGPLGC